jgi:hypothetical protein
MKRYVKYAIFILFVLALFWPSTAYAKEPLKNLFDDKVVFGGTYTLESGQSLEGNLVIFGGVVTTEADSTVNGDVVLIGGVAEIAGQVNGNFVGIGGAVQLTDTALVNGDLVTIGATLSRDEGARVTGQIVNGLGVPFTFDIPAGSTVPEIPEIPAIPEVPAVPVIPQTPRLNVTFNPLLDLMWFFFRTFMFALLAVLVVIFFDKPTTRVAKAAVDQPIITGAAGFLTAFLTPLALIAMTITIILIPVTIVTALLIVVAWLFGLIAVGLEVGNRIAKLFNTEWAPAVSAGVGTFLLFLVVGGLGEIVVCIGLLPQLLIGFWGLGAVIMTRFGTQHYPQDEATVVAATVLPEAVIPETDEIPDVETVVAQVAEIEPDADKDETSTEVKTDSEEPSSEPAEPQSDE